MNTTEKTILLRTFNSLQEASYVKDMLEQNGVECFLSNECVSQLYPIFGSTINGIRLNILESNLSKAEEILSDLQL